MQRSARCRRIADDETPAAVTVTAQTTDILNLVTVPLVTLVVAVQSIMDVWVQAGDAYDMSPHVEHSMDFAEGKQDLTKKFEMTKDEAGAINLYTQESPLYHWLNRVLRSMIPGDIEPYRLYLKLLCTALLKLPPVSGEVFRGVKRSLEELGYNVGQEVVWWGFSSTSRTMSQLQSPMFLGKHGDRAMFKLQIRSGVDIRQFSDIPSEDEILLLPGTLAYVQDTLDLGHGLTQSTLVERPRRGNLMKFKRQMVRPWVRRTYRTSFTISMGMWRSCTTTINLLFNKSTFDVNFTMVNQCIATQNESHEDIPWDWDGDEIDIKGSKLQTCLLVEKTRMLYNMKIKISDSLKVNRDLDTIGLTLTITFTDWSTNFTEDYVLTLRRR